MRDPATNSQTYPRVSAAPKNHVRADKEAGVGFVALAWPVPYHHTFVCMFEQSIVKHRAKHVDRTQVQGTEIVTEAGIADEGVDMDAEYRRVLGKACS